MATKTFAPRIAKKNRKILEIPDKNNLDIIRFNDEKLLKGALLVELELSKITVAKQVRTKFNDDSLKELAENIKANGLIQPLVVHQENGIFLLLCGERRYRAMKLINKDKAACYVLEGKTKEELMAIQFSENSSREELHYIDKAEGIYNYKLATGASERRIQDALSISKSEVHRGLILAQLSTSIQKAAKNFNIEKYVLLEYAEIEDKKVKEKIEKLIINGEITKRIHIKKFIRQLFPNYLGQSRTKKIKPTNPLFIESAEDLIKLFNENNQVLKIDEKTRKMVKNLLDQNNPSSKIH